MAMLVRNLASADGWRVQDVVCDAGPRDRPFEEQHSGFSIAIVSEGSFQYRCSAGRALLAPGALLLGNPGHCFECGHAHATGDRCLSFQYTPALFERIVAAVPGARRAALPAASLPPLAELQPLLAEAEAARDEADAPALEEAGLCLADAVVATLTDARQAMRGPSARDERRVTRALRRIEAMAGEELALAELADESAMSRYHFLRVFRQVVGLSPHQFVLRLRLHRAALRLRASGEPVATIAGECGFNDLSTFNRRFRRVMGASPGDYRARRLRALRRATLA